MKQYLILTLLVCAVSAALFSLFGDDSYARMKNLEKSLESQRAKNSALESRVAALQTKVHALRFDDKELERQARNELGMARPNEVIFQFDNPLEKEAASNPESADSRAVSLAASESKEP